MAPAGQALLLSNAFAALSPEEQCPHAAGDVGAGPAAVPRAPADMRPTDGGMRVATWNATALTEPKVHELLDKAVATATLVVDAGQDRTARSCLLMTLLA
jgi:hypothetical protein